MNRLTLMFLVFSFLLALIQVVRTTSPFPVFTYYHVKVLNTAVNNDPYTWFAVKDDGEFKIPFCHDYDVPGLMASPGNVMKDFTYEDRGTCWSIARADRKIHWERDPNTHLAVKEN